jgi:hypothetical protein
MLRGRSASIVLLAVMLAVAAGAAQAQTSGVSGFDQGNTLGPYSPRVPVSALGAATSWLDPSRLHVSTSVSVGSGFGGGTNGLQVTSLRYDFGRPMWLNVNVGNTWGVQSAKNGQFFLEGLDLGIRPFSNMMIQVHYQDVRSPLQTPYGYGLSGYAPYGYTPRSGLIAP